VKHDRVLTDIIQEGVMGYSRIEGEYERASQKTKGSHIIRKDIKKRKQNI
jgi:hypothetical protein